MFFDTVTAVISNRYRITTTLTTPGEHVIGLTIDGAPITAIVAVELPAVALNSPAPATTGDYPVDDTRGAHRGGGADAVPTTAVVGADDAAGSDDAGESPLR